MTTRAVTAPLATLILATLLAGCGGGGGGSSSQPTQNVQVITVDGGPANFPNLAFTSVTVCAPGSSNCQTIDHVQIDTGSSGLRLFASVISPMLSLPQQNAASGNPLAECAQFVDGFSWGSVRLADIHVAGEQANSVPIQIIGDSAFPTIPLSCSASGPPENTVLAFGANGLLGVGLFLQDCGGACVQSAIPGAYYACAPAGCQPTAVALASQLQNPVALFASDNNGVIIELPAISPSGVLTAAGTMIFGIGTQANNGLGGATPLPVDPNTGNIVTTYSAFTYTNSYIDAGTSVIAFGTNLYPVCTGPDAGLYCPPAIQNLSAMLRGTTTAATTVNFSIANADQLFGANPAFNAFSDLGAPSGDTVTFAWGLPFFFGRNVYTAIEGRSTPGGIGPYVAF
jgi:hypothetical protein